jgi:aerobic-type carbon monoxide dehydrogenase small subunit (CoxS/CutS family)
MLSTYQLLSKNKTTTEKEIRKRIAGNTCRCTRYQNVLKAIEFAVQEVTFWNLECTTPVR